MMTCIEVRRWRARFLAMELSAGQESELRAHLDACASCRADFAEGDPAFAVAAAMRRSAVTGSDDAFVAEVMAGVRQRRSEKHLEARRRARWPLPLAAAALLALAAGLLLVQGPVGSPGRETAVRTNVSEPAIESALVEVDGDDVRVYQLASAGDGAVQVAFVVDPRMEL